MLVCTKALTAQTVPLAVQDGASMQPRTKSVKKIYFDVGLTVLIVVLFAAFFSFQVQKDSRERVLTTLSEISSQSVEVMQKEISRNKTLLINLAVLLG